MFNLIPTNKEIYLLYFFQTPINLILSKASFAEGL